MPDDALGEFTLLFQSDLHPLRGTLTTRKWERVYSHFAVLKNLKMRKPIGIITPI
jgi:hypothetical protein